MLAESEILSEERAQLSALARAGIDQPRLCRLSRAERAASGRARCRHCREVIEQGSYRLALQLFEDGRFNSIGTIHAPCAVHYFGAEPTLERFQLLHNELSADELEEVMRQILEGAGRAILPGLAKTSGPAAALESSRKSS